MTQQEYEQKKVDCWNELFAANPTRCDIDAFDQIFDRAYALGKQFGNSEQVDADTVIQGWVARDFDGDVFLYQNEPDRNEIAWNGYMMHSLPVDSFPNLTWDSDPIEVEITIKRKKK